MSVFFRPPSWYYNFRFKNQRYRLGGYSTKKAARDAESDKRRELGAGRDAPEVGFDHAVERYLKGVVPQHANPRGESYSFGMMVERFTRRPVTAITSADLEAYKLWRLNQPAGQGYGRGRRKGARPIKPATVNRDLAYLSTFFNWCRSLGWLPEGAANPARAKSKRRKDGGGVERFDEPWRPWQTLPEELEDQLWGILPRRVRVTVELLLHLGVRRGVVQELHWAQIDWANRLAHYTSKRKSGVIPLNDRVLELLRELGPKPSGRVFQAMSDTTLRRWWVKARESVGMPTLRVHDLRVTFARRLAKRGVDLKTIQALLGHATPTMTHRYIPTDLEAQRRAVALLDHRAEGAQGERHGPARGPGGL
jgi:integrase